jgi:hypothetical protein
MILNPILGRPGEVSELFTVDFGRHWAAPNRGSGLRAERGRNLPEPLLP